MLILALLLEVALPLKEMIEALSALAPSEADRQAVARSFFGTLFGQTTVFMLTIIAYLSVLALFYKFSGQELRELYDTLGVLYFAIFVCAPLVFIAVFQILPTVMRARRERNLHPLSLGDRSPPPSYFRLHPYESTEAETYRRPDNAVTEVLNWIKGSITSVLYLSGASGSGKSSLLAAGIAPALEAEGWLVIRAMSPGTTFNSIAQSISSYFELTVSSASSFSTARSPWARPAAMELHNKITSLTNQLSGDAIAGILIVVDHFERFLVMEQEPEREVIFDLMRCFEAHPMISTKLLLVVREEYRALLFKQRHPEYDLGRTAWELAPFSRREAEGFLRGGPRILGNQSYDALFRGLDRVEGTQGLYRPITLNMVGMFLERTGSQLTDDPGRLIERYLADSLSKGASQDFNRAVLAAMITREGKRARRSTAVLVKLTGLEDWQVRATLADLRQTGLVRPIDVARLTWEINHDFLASILDRLLRRLKARWSDRAAPILVALLSGAWLSLMLIFLLVVIPALRRDVHADATHRALLYAGAIQTALQRQSAVPLLLARDSILMLALRTVRYEGAEERLATFRAGLGAGSIFMLDSVGRIVAASDERPRQQYDGDKAYFDQATADSSTVFSIIENDNGANSFLYARRVEIDEELLGVVVVTIDLGLHEEGWRRAGADIVVADSEDRVLLASEPDWRNKTVASLTTADPRLRGLRADVPLGFYNWRLTYVATLEDLRARIYGLLSLITMAMALLLPFAFSMLRRGA